MFFVTLALLAALTAGLAYFQFVIKPNMVKGFMAAAFAPKPTSVSAQPATIERWPPQLTAIGTLRAYQGIFIAPQVAGVITAIHFEFGQDVKEGDLLINLDDSVEQADLAAGQAQLRNAEATLARQKTLVLGGNTPQATLDHGARGARQRRGLGAAHAGDHRPEGDPGPVPGPHRHPQRRPRPVRGGRNARSPP